MTAANVHGSFPQKGSEKGKVRELNEEIVIRRQKHSKKMFF